ncbi:MAG: hypothetical protein JKY80_08750 [Mariprofundaceae bacterium]|nr:hypothetical protein [Mariprofundaceae bacterium]
MSVGEGSVYSKSDVSWSAWTGSLTGWSVWNSVPQRWHTKMAFFIAMASWYLVLHCGHETSMAPC